MIVKRLPLNEHYHHGIKGQKWGIRKYQNADGTLTEAGKQRYNKISNDAAFQKEFFKAAGNDALKEAKTKKEKDDIKKVMKRDQKELSKYEELLKTSITDKNIKKI